MLPSARIPCSVSRMTRGGRLSELVIGLVDHLAVDLLCETALRSIMENFPRDLLWRTCLIALHTFCTEKWIYM